MQKTATPSLRLEAVPGRAACIDELLAEIPVPREIFYQGITDDESELRCYASGLVPETPPKLGIRLSGEKTELIVRLPLTQPLRSDRDVELLLLSWVLKPFWNPERQSFLARRVPERVCRMCIRDQNLLRVSALQVPLWPERAGPEAESGIWKVERYHDADQIIGQPELPEHPGMN